MTDPASLLHELWQSALAAADPHDPVLAAVPDKPEGRIVAVGAGKASARMAEALESAWGPIDGLVVAPYGYVRPLRGIEVVEAAHPVPDEAGEAAADRILAVADGLGAGDTLACLISGGGSALLAAPAGDLSGADKRAVNEALLRSGARIQDMNCVRKHLSRIKGGRLAQIAAPARVLTLAVSDVVGDDLSVIASGPTQPDPTTCADALSVLDRFAIEAPAARMHLARGDETPKPGDAVFDGNLSKLVLRPIDVLRNVAAAANLRVLNLGDAIEGEAREVGTMLAGLAGAIRRHGTPVAPPALILSGGETTVTVRGKGKGGRNSECALGFALALADDGIFGLFADTDGIDGAGGHAGAMVTPNTLSRARAAGLDPAAELARNNSYAVFDAAGDLIVSGPTATNVNDFRAVLVI